ncbi:DUF4169 family protein [Parasulfitobacter algicola]|uniref:DUF4169 family protein n=1 Tax=Parasulfitobacter algicola TaxID=2614809 RepID=A0ABX2IU33_9RHOB|nr:DUF4169 family protein [Sulfitobacter algicola]
MKPVNLNKYRKVKARVNKKARADQNAMAFGRSKAGKQKDTQQIQTLRDKLDQHKLDKE